MSRNLRRARKSKAVNSITTNMRPQERKWSWAEAWVMLPGPSVMTVSGAGGLKSMVGLEMSTSPTIEIPIESAFSPILSTVS